MSKKVNEKKEEQGYVETGPRCGNCRRFLSDSVPVAWMVESNNEAVAAGRAPRYDLTLPANQVEKNLRCGIGGFAVKKHAYCRHWEDENE